MIAHYFKIIWKQKAKNAFLMVELVLVFWILFGVLTFGVIRWEYYSLPRGFDPEDVYRLSFNSTPDVDTTTLKSYIGTIRQDVAALPEVENASYSTAISPYLGSFWSNEAKLADGTSFHSQFLYADEDYADVWRLKIKRGRFYTKEDETGVGAPIVVNQKFADKYLKGAEPIGYTFEFSGRDVRIIGVAESFKLHGDFTEEPPFLFAPPESWMNSDILSFRVKKGVGPEVQKKVNDIVQATIRSSEFEIVRVEDSRLALVSKTLIPLLGMLFLALFLIVNIAMGLFGILRYNIAQRVSEIGLRKALGATSGAIRRQFTGEVLVITTLAFLVALLFAIQVPFVSPEPIPAGPLSTGIGLAAFLVFGIVFLCTLFPSRQAAGIPPAEALHEE